MEGFLSVRTMLLSRYARTILNYISQNWHIAKIFFSMLIDTLKIKMLLFFNPFFSVRTLISFESFQPKNQNEINCFQTWALEMCGKLGPDILLTHIQTSGDACVQPAGDRILHVNSSVGVTCFCLQHFNSTVGVIHQKISNVIVFPSWHRCMAPFFSSWDICFLPVLHPSRDHKHAHSPAVNFPPVFSPGFTQTLCSHLTIVPNMWLIPHVWVSSCCSDMKILKCFGQVESRDFQTMSNLSSSVSQVVHRPQPYQGQTKHTSGYWENTRIHKLNYGFINGCFNTILITFSSFSTTEWLPHVHQTPDHWPLPVQLHLRHRRTSVWADVSQRPQAPGEEGRSWSASLAGAT